MRVRVWTAAKLRVSYAYCRAWARWRVKDRRGRLLAFVCKRHFSLAMSERESKYKARETGLGSAHAVKTRVIPSGPRPCTYLSVSTRRRIRE